MPSCAVLGCLNYADDVGYHRFPKDKKLRKLWCVFTKRKDFVPIDSSRICSQHFEAHHYERNPSLLDNLQLTNFMRHQLKRDAVPTVFAPLLQEPQRERAAYRKRRHQELVKAAFEEVGLDIDYPSIQKSVGRNEVAEAAKKKQKLLGKQKSKPKDMADQPCSKVTEPSGSAIGESCVACGCTSRQQIGSTISFHCFPLKQPSLLEKWIQAVPVQNAKWYPSQYSAICNRHFLDEDYQTCANTCLRLLKPDAVPSVFEFTSDQQGMLTKCPEKRQWHRSGSPELIVPDLECDHLVVCNLLHRDIQKDHASVDVQTEGIVSSSVKEFRSIGVQTQVTAPLFARLENQHSSCSAQKQAMKRNIRGLRQQLRRYHDKVTSVSALVQYFKGRAEADSNKTDKQPSLPLPAGDDINDEPPFVQRIRLPVMIGTHDGTFHCHQVLACALLKMIPEYCNAVIIRTRDSSILRTCNVLVDVGGVYNPTIHHYDHHQKSFTECFRPSEPGKKRATKLSSAGLIYLNFGRRIIGQLVHATPVSPKTEAIYDKVYEHFLEEIDAAGNGIASHDGPPRYVTSTNLSSRIAHLNPSWNDPNANVQAAFETAMALVKATFLECVDHFCNRWWPARELVTNAIQQRHQVDSSGKILVLKTAVPWKEHLFSLEEKMKFDSPIRLVVFVDPKLQWQIHAVPVALGSSQTRIRLPQKWRALSNEKLSEASGIPGCTFVNSSGLVGGNKTKDGALSMARKTLEAAGTYSAMPTATTEN